MTTYTTPHSLPIIEPGVDKIKDGSEVSALAGDINGVATAANTAITAEGARAESAAIGDATTKYGRLPARVTPLETRTTTQALGTTNLDAVLVPGIYEQGSSGNATVANGYPLGVFRGTLRVSLVAGTNIAQEYTDTFTGAIYLRERSASVWTAWRLQTANMTVKLNTEHLDTISTPGDYGQGTQGNATIARGYPEVGRGSLRVVQVSGTNIGQMYWATLSKNIYIREYYNSVWGGWSKIGGGSDTGPQVAQNTADIAVINAEQDNQDVRLGTLEAQTGLANPVKSAQMDGGGLLTFTLADDTITTGVPIPTSLPTDQPDYVAQLAKMSMLSSVILKKTASNDELEVSCITGPNGTHTTYKFAGASVTAFTDDYRLQRDVWTGAVVAGVPSKDAALVGLSNKEFAFQVAPVGQVPEWVPYHGIKSAFAAEPAVITLDGLAVDVSAMATNATLTGKKMQIRQHVYGRHSSDPALNVVEIWTTHTISADGVMSVTGRWRTLTDVVIGSNYNIMCPVAGTVATHVVSSMNNSYPHNAGLNGTNTWLPIESDVATSFLMLNSATDTAIAVTYQNPAETLRRGLANKPAPGNRAWLEHRTDGTLLKLYNSQWLSGTVIPAGTAHRFSGDYIYTNIPAAFNQLAL